MIVFYIYILHVLSQNRRVFNCFIIMVFNGLECAFCTKKVGRAHQYGAAARILSLIWSRRSSIVQHDGVTSLPKNPPCRNAKNDGMELKTSGSVGPFEKLLTEKMSK
jgi:hypothetical protein